MLPAQNFMAAFEREAAKRRMTEFGGIESADSQSRNFRNYSDSVLIKYVFSHASPDQLLVSVAHGRSVSERSRSLSAMPGQKDTRYLWSGEGWLTPAGLLLECDGLAAKVIDDAL